MNYPERFGWPIIRALFVVLLAISWEAAVEYRLLDSFYVSSPARVCSRVAAWVSSGEIVVHVGATMSEAVAGLGLGMALGLILAAALIVSGTLRYLLLPLAIASNAIPKYALAPLFILWFGLGYPSKIAMVTSVVFFAVFLTAYEGMQQSNRQLHLHLTFLGASRWDRIRHISIPSSIPWLVNGVRMAVGFSLSSAIVAEYMGASRGIGYLIEHSQSFFDSTGVMAGLAVVVALALPLDFGLRLGARRLLRWQQSTIAEGYRDVL